MTPLQLARKSYRNEVIVLLNNWGRDSSSKFAIYFISFLFLMIASFSKFYLKVTVLMPKLESIDL